MICNVSCFVSGLNPLGYLFLAYPHAEKQLSLILKFTTWQALTITYAKHSATEIIK